MEARAKPQDPFIPGPRFKDAVMMLVRRDDFIRPTRLRRRSGKKKGGRQSGSALLVIEIVLKPWL